MYLKLNIICANKYRPIFTDTYVHCTSDCIFTYAYRSVGTQVTFPFQLSN